MIGHFGNRHHLAELINVLCQSSSNPDIGVEQLQFLNADPLAYRAKQLAVVAMEPDLSGCQIQVTHAALGPTVGAVSFMPALVAHRFKAFMRQYLN